MRKEIKQRRYNVYHQSVGTSMSSDMSSIIIAAVLVLATGLASVLMDKAGRKVLLLISSAFMVVSLGRYQEIHMF